MGNLLEYFKRVEWIIYLLILIVGYIILYFFFAYIGHALDLEWAQNTGPLGDTFGGLFSPIIGLVSFILVYRTFKAQREQLADQVRATNFAGSSLYFVEVSNMISDVKLKLTSLEYKEYTDMKVGYEAMNAFKEDLSIGNLADDFLRNGLPLLRFINEQLILIQNLSVVF